MINSAVELGSNFADKIGRFYRSSVIALRLTTLLRDDDDDDVGDNTVVFLQLNVHTDVWVHITVGVCRSAEKSRRDPFLQSLLPLPSFKSRPLKSS